MTNKGWRGLTEIVSRGFIEGQQLSIPCVQKDWVLEQSQDLIVLLGLHSDVGEMLCAAYPEKAEPLLEQMDRKIWQSCLFSADAYRSPIRRKLQ